MPIGRLNARTTKKELKEFIAQGFQERREREMKIKKIKNARCADWKVREKSGLIKLEDRQSHWTGAPKGVVGPSH